MVVKGVNIDTFYDVSEIFGAFYVVVEIFNLFSMFRLNFCCAFRGVGEVFSTFYVLRRIFLTFLHIWGRYRFCDHIFEFLGLFSLFLRAS